MANAHAHAGSQVKLARLVADANDFAKIDSSCGGGKQNLVKKTWIPKIRI